jgi:predicted porin
MASAAVLGLMAASHAQAASFAQTDPSKNSSAFPTSQNNPDPGKIIVRMGGLVAVDVGGVGNSSDKSNVNSSKLQPYGISGYFRLYFGVDGKLTNGMIYGASSEMRTNFAGGAAGGYSLAAGSAGVGNGSANSTASLWYTRRAYTYIGADSWGVFRIGQTDGPLSLFTGSGITSGEAYDTGQWDGDICDFIGSNCLSWVFPDVGNEYDPAKITYMSPKFGGFSFGVDFAPSSAALTGVDGDQAIGGGSARQSTSSVGSDVQRPRNEFEIAGRWQGNLGPVAIDGFVGYWGSGIVDPTSAAVLPAGTTKVNGLSIIDGGLSATINGWSVFGGVNGGKTNGQAGTPQVVLASGRKKDQFAYIVGGQWSQGPYTVGASWYSVDNQGSNSGTGNRTQRAFDVGGQYTVVTGLDFFLEYIWGQQHQNGVNFVDGGAGLATANNKETTNAVLATILVRW